ncbi:MAG: lpsC [Phenylobacterium sp.]|nr:lpsC [Phenylobacterium sp.]MDB5495967.1 lpsC [Phenylobacterium sp.]
MKFFDLELDQPDTRKALDAAYRRVMASGRLILGPELEAFEGEFAAFCGSAHCAGVGNGLDALSLALRAAGISAGDEVIVPAHTFAATWLAVTAVGGQLKPVEVDPTTYTLDPDAVRAAIGPRTRAVIPVSLYGHPADLDPIMALAREHGLFVLEDAAQSHGAGYRGRRAGATAHATAFSFYPTKNLGALGDAGAVVTADPALDRRIRQLRNYGSERKYVHEIEGVNSRLDELQAAFLRVRLARLERNNGRRRDLADHYAEQLGDLSGLTLPCEAAWAEHVYHLFVVRTPERDRLQDELRRAGVETLIHYPVPCHLQAAFADLGMKAGDFPITETLAQEVLSLPLWPGMGRDGVNRVAGAARAALGRG